MITNRPISDQNLVIAQTEMYARGGFFTGHKKTQPKNIRKFKCLRK